VKTKVAKRGSNAEGEARDVNADEREKRYLMEERKDTEKERMEQ